MSRMSACVPVRKTRPRSSVYLSSREAAARAARSMGAFMQIQSVQAGKSKFSYSVPDPDYRLGRGARPDARLRRRGAIPVGLRAEGLGEEVDEHARLRREEAPVRIDGVDSHLREERIVGKQGDERAVRQLAVDIPGGLERDAEASERPFAQYFPVVASVASMHAHRARAAVGSFVVPGRREVGTGKAVVAAQILRRSRRAVQGEIRRTRANHATIRRQLARG